MTMPTEQQSDGWKVVPVKTKDASGRNTMAEKEYIEREALCYQLEKQATIDGQPRAIKRATKIVANFPAADVVERKTGKWIHLGGDEWCCSSCGYVITTEGSWEHPIDTDALYCKHCGAKMEESGDV